MLRRFFTTLVVLGALTAGGIAISPRTVSYVYAGEKDVKEETVYITNTGSKYHKSWCRYLRKSKIPVEKSEAIAWGYTPCKVCKP